jgi:DNA-directed RNA polymerase subunit H (RpoH/RPB5)
MSKTEVSELTSDMGLTVTNLPKILITDPQVQKIEAKVGDVLEINRDDFGRKYKQYRLVVED